MKYGIKIGGILCLGVALFVTLSSVEQNSTETSQSQYVQNPPIATQYWVQKIRTPEGVEGGEYSVVIKAEFEHDLPLPDVLNIYKNGEVAQVLRDDGNYPDNRANDGVFATIVNQDPTEFANEVMARMNNIQTRGYGMKFTGHLGEIVKYRDVKPFNYGDFQHFQIQEFDEILLESATPCEMQDEILKRNSLLITDINVVEDEGRTFNVVTGQGTEQGAWTFGELMKNMAGGFADEAAPTDDELDQVRDFLKEWIIQLYTPYTINSITASGGYTEKVLKFIPYQWMKIADSTYQAPASGDYESWKTDWDTHFTTADKAYKLLASAPFKLTAIVNRLDVRGNAGYYMSNSGVDINAGETRFIFSLIHGVNENLDNGNGASNAGNPPIFYPTGHGSDGGGTFADWNGMNIIFEYSNIASSSCDIKALGQHWKDLSRYNLDSLSHLSSYLDSLQLLTDLVTTRNANLNGVNGSAISQVRTNSKLFSSATNHARWKLREFRLDATTGFLVNAPTRNMPLAHNNTRRNSNPQLPMDPNASSQEIVDWIYGVNGPSKEISVKHGNHNIPEHLTSPNSVVVDEMQSYFGIGYWNTNFPDNIYDDDNYTLEASLDDKKIRHQLSLNTCMGCHAAETKTLFTMIRPLGYGQEADYWSLVPSTTTTFVHNSIDMIDNAGTTLDSTHTDADADGFIENYTLNYYQGASKTEIRTIPNVSAFLTGRNFRDGDDLSGDDRWNDDFENQGSDDEVNILLRDQAITGLFYVNDPSNEANIYDDDYIEPGANPDNDLETVFPQHHDQKFGFNELENRQMDLCQLTSTSCSNAEGGVLDVLAHLDFVPLSLHGH